MDTASLRDGLFAAACGEDLILLDTLSGQYDLAAGAARGLVVDRTGAGITFLDPEVREAFDAAGLLGPITSAGVPLPSLPRRSVLTGTALVGFGALARHGWALLEMAGHYPHRALPDLIDRVRAKEPSANEADLDSIRAQALSFDRLLAWTPWQGACVYRAYMLRRLLQDAGHSGVQWVFGVRTWPFYAHCWLQLGELALTDHAEGLGAFTPIFAV